MLDVMRRTSADVVIGSRYIPGGGTHNWPLSRLIMSRLACVMARPLTPVRDATSGFFLIRRDLARGVRISAGGFKICLELLVRSQPASVVEVPYVFEGRTAGDSKMSLREALGYLVQLRDLHRFQRSRPRVPQTYSTVRL
jgi:dolichol-phosphate mannosyltransferase